MRIILSVWMLTFAFACATPEMPESSLEASFSTFFEGSGIDRYFDVEPTNESPIAGTEWLRQDFDQQDGPRCLWGTDYFTSFREGTENNLMLFLRDGGACWNQDMCDGGFAFEEAELPPSTGLLADNATHSLRSWHTVYAPYCDGSVFVGDNRVSYGSRIGYHNGLANLSAAIGVMKDKVPNPDKIFVTGSSAGGFGSFFAIAPVRLTFPDAEIYMLSDSGPAMFNPDNEVTLDQTDESWGYRGFIPEECTRCDPQFTYLAEFMADNDPNFKRFALFHTYEDTVIRSFLTMNGPDLGDLIESVTDDIESRMPDRFGRYLPNGDFHTIFLNDGYQQAYIGNKVVMDWIDEMIDDDPSWQDWVDR